MVQGNPNLPAQQLARKRGNWGQIFCCMERSRRLYRASMTEETTQAAANAATRE